MTAFEQFILALVINLVWVLWLFGWINLYRKEEQNTGKENRVSAWWKKETKFKTFVILFVAALMVCIISLL